MAGIDKIYGSQKEYLEFKNWLTENRPDALQYVYEEKGFNEIDRPISNFPENIDKWLMKNCSLNFIQVRLKEQYGKQYKGPLSIKNNKPKYIRKR